MKTAMQELIEYSENMRSTYDFSFDKFFTKANELLEKEKQQIIEAVNSQRQLGWDEKGEQFYNETYKD